VGHAAPDGHDAPVGHAAPDGPARDLIGQAERVGVLDEVRLQSVRIGVASTVAVLLVLCLYALLPGHYPLSRAPFFTLIGIAIAGTVPIALLPWQTLARRGLVMSALYTWSLFDIVLGTDGSMRGAPIQITYQPNWWFQVVLNLVPDSPQFHSQASTAH